MIHKKNSLDDFIYNIDDFISSLEQIWRNEALHHLITKGSWKEVNGCRQNKSPNSYLKTS